MRAALLQLEPVFGIVERNVARAAELIASLEADLFVLPELFPSGYSFAAQAEVERMAEPAGDGPTFAALAEQARRKRAWICYGFAERAAGRYYNSANLVGPEGLAGTYRKLHLFGRETLFFTPGEAAAPVFELPIGRVGVMICFDWYFPEVARSLALRGAQVIVHPSNLVLPHCPQAMLTRSLENRVFSLTCDRTGQERNGAVEHRFIGMSQAVNPRGELLVRLGAEHQETAVVEFDPAAADDKQVTQYNDLFGDRRPALYSPAML